MIYGVNMLLRQLDEDEEAAAVFDRYAPGLRALAGQAGEGGGLSIRQIARYTHGMIPDESLEKMDAELKAVGKKNGGISPAERQRMEEYQRIAAADAAREDVPETFENTAIHPGKVWLDTRGRRIQAHAGGIFYEDGVYYWYGENKEHTDGKSLI